MPDPLRLLADLQPQLAHAVPVLFLLGAVLAGRASVPPRSAWRRARTATGAAGIAAAAALVAAALSRGGWATAQAVVLTLIAFVGWVLTRFSGTYLAGESDQPRFARWLLCTLAGSSLVVASGNFGVMVLAWLATSLSLQHLLTHYRERPAARMAAHKKFLVSRVADACLATAAVLFALRFGTLEIDAMAAAITSGEALRTEGSTAVVLVAAAVLLRSAQLPFHGWLMQVMEAPTPVSALLHAGVVNLGGFVLIRLQVLVQEVAAAQVALVVVGGATAALAALVARTRISIKVALAWSTCAQMGFMVLQCGLGLFEMALLHLVAHSLYKARAFLGAGSAVDRAVVAGLSRPLAPARPVDFALGLAASLALVAALAFAFGGSFADSPGSIAMGLVAALALAPLFAGGPDAPHWTVRAALPVAVATAWFGLHRALHAWLPTPPPSPAAAWLAVVAAACLALAFAVQVLVTARPNAPLARRLHAWFFGGLFLDEWFTRATLRLWPDRSPSRPTPPPALTRPLIGSDLR